MQPSELASSFSTQQVGQPSEPTREPRATRGPRFSRAQNYYIRVYGNKIERGTIMVVAYCSRQTTSTSQHRSIIDQGRLQPPDTFSGGGGVAAGSGGEGYWSAKDIEALRIIYDPKILFLIKMDLIILIHAPFRGDVMSVQMESHAYSPPSTLFQQIRIFFIFEKFWKFFRHLITP